MATLALDTATITKALAALEEMELAPCTWTPTNPAQEQFLTWYYSNRKAISQLNHLEALVSDSYTVLNSYLEELGFVGMFEPFDGLGVASVLDLLLEWVEEGSVTTFKRVVSGLQAGSAWSKVLRSRWASVPTRESPDQVR
jgi:hypothetical protein